MYIFVFSIANRMNQEHIGCDQCKSRLDSIFNDLKKNEVSTLDSIKKCQFYKKGESIFTEGAYPRGLFCVQSGKIKVTQFGMNGKEQIVHLIHSGDVMGHRAIFGDDTFSCSAIAMEDSHVCFISKAPFYQMVEESSHLALKFAHLLATELKEAEQRISQSALRPVKERLAKSLLILIENYGFESDQATINIIVKREDLANLSGTTRETATRYLYELQEDKIIELIEKKIKIIKFKELKSLAHTF